MYNVNVCLDVGLIRSFIDKPSTGPGLTEPVKFCSLLLGAVNGTSQNFTKLGEAEKHLLAAKIITDGRLLGSLLTKSLDASWL